MAQKRSTLAKVFVYVALAAVLIGVIAPFITYFGVEYFDWNKCEEWYIRNEETQECEEEMTGDRIDITEYDNEESCTQAWWTRYEENNICIWTNEIQNKTENDVEIKEEVDDEVNEEANNEIVEEVND